MSVVTSGTGHFAIPTAPAAGTSVTSGAANTFTTTYVQLIASTGAALYITGIFVESATALGGTYAIVQLATGAAASEVVIGQHLVALSTGSTTATGYKPIFPPIPVANATRIAVKTADSVGAKATLITLECINQSNVVDDGITVTKVTTVTTVTNQLTAAAIATGVWQDATAGDFTTASSIGKALFTGNVAPGGAGGLMISGTNSGTTTLGALTITGVTTHTGNVVLSDGLTISAPSTGNRAGLDITGNGTGAALKLAAGATGKGIAVTTTAGDALSLLPTAGSAIVATGNGTSKFGIIATGGTAGTSDGVSFVAGSGGVDFRANQTGNLTGNVSGSIGSVTGAVGSVTGAVGSVTGAVGSVTGAVGSVTGAVGSVTGAVGSVTAAVSVTGDLSATMKTSVTTACTASTPTAAAVTGNVGGNVTGSVGSVVGLTASNLDATVSSRLATASYTAPDNASVAAVKTQTDKLAFTVANKLDVNILVVNGVTIKGSGTTAVPWGPV